MSAEPAVPPAVDAQPVRSSTKIASDTLAHRPSCWLMQTPGSGPSLAAHCASVEQGPQVLLAVSQIGFAMLVVQSESARHSTQTPPGPQNGFAVPRAAHASLK